MPNLSMIFRLLCIILCLLGGSCQENNLTDTSESSVLTPLIDSNTNWLLACADDTDCGEGQCSCGACIIPCQAELGCRLSPDLEQLIGVDCQESNEVLSDLSCEEDMPILSIRMCIPSCEVDRDCPATFRCRNNHCAPPPRMRDRECEETCRRSGRDPRRCYVQCQRAQRRRQEEAYQQMMMTEEE